MASLKHLMEIWHTFFFLLWIQMFFVFKGSDAVKVLLCLRVYL